MKYDGLLVGLGNPGTKYARTRHSFGFMVMDRALEYWSKASGCSCDERPGRSQAQVWDVVEDNGARRWLVAKPLTFMNLSGQVVGGLSRKHGISAERILVAHDELDLVLGTVRLKFGGGLAGHNGLKSVAALLGTRDFARMRLGIGRPDDGLPVAEYVLRPFFPDQRELVDQTLAAAVEGLLDYCRGGLTVAMNRLNAR